MDRCDVDDLVETLLDERNKQCLPDIRRLWALCHGCSHLRRPLWASSNGVFPEKIKSAPNFDIMTNMKFKLRARTAEQNRVPKVHSDGHRF
jgi:hypothetical protein